MSPVLRTALFGTAVGLALMAGPALAGTIKVGVIAPVSGPFGMGGQMFKQAIEVYQAQHGKTVGGDTIEFIYKDLEAANPAQSKALAQELIVKEKVSFLAGFFFTPDALAVAPLIDEAKIPCVIFNAATSAITEKSPLYVRTSFTLWQASVPLAEYVHKQGVKKVITAVSDYGPGIDGETAFKTTFEKAGGQVVDSIRMPLKSTDFAPFMQRIKDSGAEAVYAFLPAGPTTLAFAKAFNETGLKAAGVKFFGPGDITQEPDLQTLGDAAAGFVTAFHYSQAHDSAMNKAFVAKHKEMFGSSQNVTFTSVGAYDGTHLIYKMVEATGGKPDGLKAVEAVKNLSWESPRGPLKLDPLSRTVIQTMYIRVTERTPDGMINKEIAAIPDQPDYGYKGAK